MGILSKYIKTIWSNNTDPAINETNKNKVENQLEILTDQVNDNYDQGQANKGDIATVNSRLSNAIGALTEDSEVVDARVSSKFGSFTVLKDRLDNSDALFEAQSLTPKQLGGGYLINGNFDVWQRGDTISGAGLYGADRWKNQNDVEQYRSVDVPDSSSEFSNRITALSTNTFRGVFQLIESNVARAMADNDLHGSVWIKADQNAIDSNPFIALSYANSKDNFSTTTAIENIFFGGRITANQWSKVDFASLNLPSGVKNGLKVVVNVQGNVIPANPGICYISQFKIGLGLKATTFIPKTFAEELRDCRRYYYDPLFQDTGATKSFAQGQCVSATRARLEFKFNDQMRTSPTRIETGNLALYGATGSVLPVTATSIFSVTKDYVVLTIDVAGGLVGGNITQLIKNADTTATIAFDAEI